MNATTATDATNDNDAPVSVRSDLLGEIQAPESTLYHFPQGLYGFEDAHHFALLPAERDGLFWLQSLDFTALAFLLADPFRWVENYNVELPDADLAPVAPATPADLAVLAIVTLPGDSDTMPTANLQGPVCLNVRERVGRQIVIQESEYDTRYALDLFSGISAN